MSTDTDRLLAELKKIKRDSKTFIFRTRKGSIIDGIAEYKNVEGVNNSTALQDLLDLGLTVWIQRLYNNED